MVIISRIVSLPKLLAFTVGLITIDAQLFPIEPKFREDIYNVVIPSERQSLDDCATWYYRYGRYNLNEPVLGTPVDLNEFAHMTAVGVQRTNDIDWYCGGSLISDNWVLSAAHCSSNTDGIRANRARLGDRNPFTSLDDDVAQQFNIVEWRNHPNYRAGISYFDIALFRLDRNIRPTLNVLPACMYTLNDTSPIRDFTLEAFGFGASGFADDNVQRFEKVGLNFVDSNTCRNLYGARQNIPNGLMDSQLCAIGAQQGNLRPDTCQGDSGGPLQVKLLGNGRMTSFIIGVVSFGTSCGVDPGIYTRVASAIDFIESTVGLSFEPRRCVLRYVSLREFQPDLIESRPRTGTPQPGQQPSPSVQNNTQSAFRSGLSNRAKRQGETATRRNEETERRTNWINSKIHIAQDYRHKSYIGIYRENGQIYWYCGASLIAEQWLVTAAHCLKYHPTLAQVGDLRIFSSAEDDVAQIREIEFYIPHPDYDSNETHDDIGLVKLKGDIKLSLETVPACLWKEHELPTDTYEVVGWGSRISNLFFIDLPEVTGSELDEVFAYVTRTCDEACQVERTKLLEPSLDRPDDDEIRYLEINSTVLSNTACNNYFVSRNLTEIGNSQLCLQNNMFTIPGICELDIGGPVERKIWGYNEYSSFIFGVNSFGKNCGFGSPAVTTRVSSYANWIESIVLQKRSQVKKRNTNSLHWLNLPTDIRNLPQFGSSVSANTRPTLRPGQDSIVSINNLPLRDCIVKYKQLRDRTKENVYENNKVFTHSAAIGFPKLTGFNSFSRTLQQYLPFVNSLNRNEEEEVEYKCWGALVSENLVVTTASCIAANRISPCQVRLGNQNAGYSEEIIIVPLTEVIIHEEYVAGKFYNDIAALRLAQFVLPTPQIVSACLWSRNDYVPFVGVVPMPFALNEPFSCGNGICGSGDNQEKALLSMQKDECERAYRDDPVFDYGVPNNLLCAQAPLWNLSDACIGVPGAVFQKGVDFEGINVPYIVGLYSYSRDCENDKPAVFTRISAYADWILSKSFGNYWY